MSPSVQVEGLSKNFGKFTALESVSFEIDKPGCYAILGPNGAGKTTLFRILTTLIYPDSGRILMNGKDIFRNKEEALKEMGSLVSVPEPPDFMTVREFIQFAAKLRGREADVESLNARLDLPNLNSKCGKLSKGQKRRTFLAAVIAQDPQILILDEPTDGLDPIEIYKVKSVIREIKQNKTILYSSHILSEVIDMCDYVFIMNKGKIIYKGSVTNLERIFRPTSVKVEFEYQINPGILKELLAGMVTRVQEDGDRRFEIFYDGDSETRKKILRKLVETYDVRSFYDSSSSLENAFVRVLGVFGGRS
ncbi:ABC transporter ATP-binding protein [Sulfuracidifex tepidarius]|uniref:Branched-chain amino acid transport ATP-binding protein LivG n=1 Tax=Sulfuracidifex tepidarius TaxID=1294262 RepID=A0A510E2U9_9CREN|nr:ABC transporter ATP-binding protein [Sulfuracidifex tepidarius]BBG23653.1 putative branched-chain amino acid transport ATP-binding protein LivG [Sulfuracidifex tepidarius]BBG26400.1 putative branched-chain amino acid transport ATP-binding protein LivG [Sulfuracidifex tepidarius]